MSAELEIRADLLDCLQANLAVLADRWHGPGAHLRLGATLSFQPRTEPGSLPTVEPTVDEQLASAQRLTGLHVAQRWPAVDGARLVELADAHGVLYVLADAYHLPWVPYHRNRHLEHSFLVEPGDGGLTMTDAYFNDTPTGAARPCRRHLSPADLLAALPDGAEVVRLTPGPPGEAPAPEVTGFEDVEHFRHAYAGAADRVAAFDALTLQTWLLARSRKLHSAYLDATGVPGGDARTAHLVRWDQLAEQTYLAARRVQRGRAEPPALLATLADILAADRAVFGAAPATTETRDAVVEVVSSVLRIPPGLTATSELSAVPTFSSFRMLEIVDRLEDRFRIEFDAGDLVPERLHRVDDLCDLVLRTRHRRGAALTTGGGRDEH